MVLQTQLDREKQEEISLLLTAADGGDPQMSGTVKIHITVLDANDNAPVFTQRIYKASVAENAPKGTLVARVRASDADEGSNAHIQYLISHSTDGVGELFALDPITGDLNVAGKLDFEKDTHYELDIQAKDDGDLTDSSKILVEVTDINDNTPMISVVSFSNDLHEDALPGTVIAVLNVQDSDSGSNGNVHCSINENMPFKVISSSNNFYSLVTESTLDRETTPEYNITVIATDEGLPALSSSLMLTLKISDVNDNAPVFEQRSSTAYLMENNTPGLSIFSVKASDADWKQNARISYILEETVVNGVPISSYISVNSENRETQEEMFLLLTAIDGGDPQMSGTVKIHITVLDANDNAPVFTQRIYKASVVENAIKGTLVTTVSASDADKGTNGHVTYTVSHSTDSAGNVFDVDPLTGEVKLTEIVLQTQLDREKDEEISLLLIATDGGDPQMSGTVKIHITVLDANDNAPVFSQAVYKAVVVENAIKGSLVTTVTATDLDKGLNGQVTYSISRSTDGKDDIFDIDAQTGEVKRIYKASIAENAIKGTLVTTVSASDDDKGTNAHVTYSLSHIKEGLGEIFYLDPNTGEVKVSGQIDFEKTKHYQMNIQAKDDGGLIDSSKLVIEVIDINDNSPVISVMSFSNSVPEDTLPGTVIAVINVHDPDAGSNGHVHCSLNENIPFKVTSSSNRFYSLTTESNLDRETQPEYNITITASDEGVPPLSNTLTLTLKILDVNDNVPDFGKSSYKAHVIENNTPGLSICAVKASDADLNQNARVTYILEETTVNGAPVSSYISVNYGSKQVEMMLQKQLDREKQEEMSLLLTAVDGGDPQLSGTVKILINVLDANDNPPVFTQSIYKAVVVENAPKGTLVTTVSASDADKGINGLVMYSVSHLTDSISKLFDLDSHTEMMLQKQLDREKQEEMSLLLTAVDGGDPQLSGTVKILINVLDANDNPPVFTQSIYKAVVVENAPKGTLVTTVSASDADKGINGLVMYSVSHLTDSIDGSKQVEMMLQKQLDREKQEEMSLLLTAVDGGDPQLSGTVKILINVLDANDNPPVFTQSIYKAVVVENAPKGTLVTTVSASDADKSINGLVMYSVSHLTDSIGKLFDLDSHTGEVKVIGQIDYEKAKHFQINIQAKDNGGLFDSCKVIIDVIDVNDNIPAITLMSVSNSVAENALPGTVIAMINVQDQDSANNGFVHCTVNDNIPFKITSSSNNFYNLVTDKALDRETDSEYNITITATDEGVPALSSNFTLCLKISDVNDNAPVFEKSSYTAHIKENNTPGLSLFSVRARDADWNQNARISYILQEISIYGAPVSSYISVNSESGVIHAVRSFDYEQIKSFTFGVKAQDGGSPPLSSNVTVSISDVNDNAPVFEKRVYAAYITENNTPGLSVSSVKASDADWNQNARISYILEETHVNGVSVSSYVSVNSDSGVIHAVRSFDYEQIKSFTFGVKAQDGGSPPLSSNVTVSISVVDANDNPPVFTQALYKASVLENVLKGTLVLKVSASDVDKGANAEVTYSFIHATDSVSELFDLDSITGEIKVRGQFDFERSKQYEINVEAVDNGGLADSCKVLIEIIDVNDNAPVITLMSFSNPVPENCLPETVIAMLNVKDLDSGKNGQIRCSSDHSLPFRIKSSSANFYNLVTDQVLDRENVAEYNITIIATDEGSPPFSSKMTLTLQISDVNDNAPIFDQQSYSTYIKENNAPGISIFSLKAEDADFGPNAHISYFLDDKSVNGIKVSSKYVEMMLQTALDREEKQEHNLILTAKDGGDPQRSGTMKIHIIVLDANDNAPVFSQALYKASVSENALKNTVILTVSASDADEGTNGDVIYSFSHSTDSVSELIAIDPHTGEIKVIGDLDYETSKAYEINIQARDHGGLTDSSSLPLCAQKTVTVSILDVNDNQPVFGQPSYSVYIKENSAAGTILCSVSASDPDLGDNAKISYSILDTKVQDVSISSYIYINSGNGSIYSMHSLDYEKLKVFQIQVQARDHGSPPLSSNVTVHVFILDQNDNVPAVIYPSADMGSVPHQKMPRSAKAGHLVTKVTAVDADSGHNAWISYKLVEATDASLFSVNLYTGEVRTRRAVSEQDDSSQRLLIEMKDNGEPVQTGTTHITVKVLDINDNAPQFEHALYEIPLSENSPKGSVVVTVKAIDSDEGLNGEIVYSFATHTSETVKQFFNIHPDTGEITVNGQLDYESSSSEKQSVHELTLTAIDGGKPARSGTTQISVQVLDINDNAPHFEKSLYEMQLQENSAKDTVILTLKAVDLDQGSNGEILYSFAEHTSEKNQNMFKINAQNGEITVTADLDYEKTAMYEFDVRATDKGTPAMEGHCTVQVEILDVNDNAPDIILTSLPSPVPEDASVGTVVALINVATNSLSSYTLNKNEHFALNVKSNKDGTKVPELILEKALDRERQPIHQLVLTAIDGGNPARTGTTHITVKVLDINDNAPQFEHALYEIPLSENSPKGSVVVTVKAIDSDEGLNGEIVYSFATHTSETVKQFFNIHPDTGEITVNGQLDYESSSSFKFDVRATDKGTPAMEGHSSVQVEIIDVNDNPPEIIITSLPKPVREDASIGTVVALISARDLDSGDNGKVQLNVPAHLPFKLKPSFSNHYALVTDSQLDREVYPEYRLEIVASDSGSPPLIAKKEMIVNILDVNDNPPRFSQSSYTVYMNENEAPGKILCSVSASDPDLGDNAKISYSILDTKVQDVSISSYIYINSDNGSIYSMHSLDYEKLKVFQIQVQARDHGSPPLSSNVTVHVFILDQNDNVPAVIYPSADMGSVPHQKMPRSAKAGHLVTKVTAVDADSGHNAWISYKLVEATDASLFSVNLKFPELVLEKPLDREKQPTFRLLLTATDGGTPEKSGTTVVLITILDVNDNAPVFDHPVKRVSLLENSPPGTLVTKLNATDMDYGLNGELVYLFSKYTSDAVLQLFSVDAQTGEIRVNGLVDYEVATIYDITVQARDKGSPAMEGSCNIKVEIADVNDNAPEIIITSLSSPVREDAASDTVIALIRVRDHDSAHNGDVTLQMPPGLPFKLSSSFKEHYTLITSGPLDREKVAEYSIVVTATDSGSPRLSSQITIPVSLSDVNDNPPVFSQPSYTVEIAENNAPGSHIATVSASDPDVGRNSQLSFSILESRVQGTSVSSYVYINAENGNVYSMRSLDYEQMNAFQIEVQVRDAGTPLLTSNVTVHVFVVDENDNDPVIVYPVFPKDSALQLKVPQSAGAGYLINKIVGVDADSGHNAWLSYSIPPGQDLFRVATHTGELRTARKLQEEEGAVYDLVIVVKDNGTPVRSTTVSVSISVEEKGSDTSSEFRKTPARKGGMSDITLYLIISLACISAISFLTFVILIVKCLRHKGDYSSSCLDRCCHSRHRLRSRHAQRSQKNLHLQLNTDGPIKYLEVVGGPPESHIPGYRPYYSTLSNRSDFVFIKSPSTPMMSKTNTLNMSLSRKHLINTANEVRMLSVPGQV
ncbi:FAT4 protein, partial [Amia calva]|nr:FAT4 protein [Amia calva]